MNPLLIAAIVTGAFILLSKGVKIPNLLNPSKGPPSPPGPAAQQQGATRPAGSVTGWSPYTANPGSLDADTPNSTLTTINKTVVVANNALGQLDKLASYFGIGDDDSEYPVPGTATNYQTPTGEQRLSPGYYDIAPTYDESSYF